MENELKQIIKLLEAQDKSLAAICELLKSQNSMIYSLVREKANELRERANALESGGA